MILSFTAFCFMLNLNLVQADFPICTASLNQYFPKVIFENSQFYTFWRDSRSYSSDSLHGIFGARVTESGTVIDPDGKMQFKRQADTECAVAYDGNNLLVVFRDSC